MLYTLPRARSAGRQPKGVAQLEAVVEELAPVVDVDEAGLVEVHLVEERLQPGQGAGPSWCEGWGMGRGQGTSMTALSVFTPYSFIFRISSSFERRAWTRSAHFEPPPSQSSQGLP